MFSLTRNPGLQSQTTRRRHRSLAALLPWTLWLSACGAPVSACGAPQPQHPQGGSEIELNELLPADPAPPKLKPCSIDDAEGCGVAKKVDGQLDPSQRYEVPVAADDPVLGPANAPVTIVVFSDFQCPYCARMSSVIEELREEFSDKVRIVWKDLPLPMHPFAAPAALLGRAAYAAGGSAKFWQAHHEIYERQAGLSDELLAEIAKELRVPWPAQRQLAVHIDRDVDLANELRVDATPTSFINGRPISGAKSVDVFAARVREELAR